MRKLLLAFLMPQVFLCCFYSSSYAAIVDVSMNNFSFQSQNLTITAGDTVRWTNLGGSHTTTSGNNCTPDGKWDSGFLSAGQSYTTPATTFNSVGTYPYFCTPHCSMGMTGYITVTAASTMQVPASRQSYVYTSIESPGTSTDPAQARPVGVGSVATGGSTLTIRINTLQFSGAVDIYFGVFAPAIDQNNIFILDQYGSLQLLSSGLVAWKSNIYAPLDETPFGNIQKVALPAGTYSLYLFVTPAGTQNSYYLWQTDFVI